MLVLTLPDGNKREFASQVTGFDVAKNISKSLAKVAVAIKINGNLYDLSHIIDEDANIDIITADSEDGLEIIRHDAAHISAEAVKELYPDTQVTIGPVIENGFYYDFARSTPFTLEDLKKIESHMKKIVARNDKIQRKVVSKQEAIDLFKQQGEHYKVEIINELPEGEEISLYTQGNFVDLCRGPHSPSTGKIKAFKLLKVAGAYWRGDSNNEMLQRIYGTAWANEEQLKAYLHMLEEAEKRDHRKLGKEMDLFHFQDCAPGAVFWHHKGWAIFRNLINYMRDRQNMEDYTEISTPELMDYSIWETSGHAEKFGENMFTAIAGDEEKRYAIKPMNCPGSVLVFKSKLTSYKDLPMRVAEFGKVHRFEPSGALHGLLRVRAFTQDDAHIFCTQEQMESECINMCRLVMDIYKDFGFEQIRVKFSDRPEKRLGGDDIWDKSEEALINALKKTELEYSINKGEGAFYGPKLEFVLRDAIGRDWQLGTIQLDLNLPERFDINYIGQDGNKHRPVMLHRALFGSLERFMGILLEHHAGKLPLWLAPVQVVVCSITNEVDDYTKKVYSKLKTLGFRVSIDVESDKIGYKVRKHSLAKVPIILAIGKEEAQNNTVCVRELGRQGQKNLEFNEFISKLQLESKKPSII